MKSLIFKFRHMIFPLAIQLNSSASMILVIALGLAGQSVVAADIAVVHGATLAFLLSFAANGRSIILNSDSSHTFSMFARMRLLLWLPLAVASLTVSLLFSNVVLSLAIAVIIRRSAEWFAELVISEAERLRLDFVAVRFIVADAISLVVATVGFVLGASWTLSALCIWAILPAIISLPMLKAALAQEKMRFKSLSLLPHFGSSLVTGTATYVFRVLIVQLVGKEVAGTLFGAFAIGSVAGTAFSTGIGPTLVLQNKLGTTSSGRVVFLTAVGLASAGVAVLGVTSFLVISSEASRVFWQAAGLSLVGGALMVQAQYYRLKQLQESSGQSVFPADVFANILAVAVLPSLHYLWKGKLILAAYFVNAVIALIIYWHISHQHKTTFLSQLQKEKALAGVYFLVLLPVFVQAGSGLFRDPAFLFDSSGSITRLPIPLSVAACGLGYLLLKGLEYAQFSLSLIFFAFLTLIIAGIGGTVGQPMDQPRKLILATQFLLPMFSMPLGQLVGRAEFSLERVARSFLYVLALVVPAQLVATWFSGYKILQPYIWLFSVYQHLQYVPVVFVAAYILCVFVLWDKAKHNQMESIALILGGPVMGIYALLSGSLLSSVGLVFCLVLHTLSRRGTNFYKSAISLAIATIVAVYISFLFGIGSQLYFKLHGGAEGAEAGQAALIMPVNAAERLAIWQYYLEGTTQSVSTFILGNPNMPDRTVYPSAHNYYLDLLYNFGLLGLVPIVLAVMATFKRVMQNWPAISRSLELQALAGVVMFLLIVDSSLKVGLRQPYPGLFAFFLWGILLSKLPLLDRSNGYEVSRQV